jgi:glycosyltransferase involved in cell wall biosynthesis
MKKKGAGMKILYYNWAYFWGDRFDGGGVSVYQKNLIDGLSASAKGHAVYFLSSGRVYNVFSKKVYIRKTPEPYKNCKCYEIVNSPVIAPAAVLFNNLSPLFADNDTRVLDVLARFVKKHGPFDILHINNIEGLPLNIFRIKEKFPHLRIIFSIHNYNIFCPFVNLFNYPENKSCDGLDKEFRCFFCKSEVKLDLGNQLWFYTHGIQNIFVRKVIKKILFYLFKGKVVRSKALSFDFKTEDEDLKSYTEKCVAIINKYTDGILSVSRRVKEIAVHFGIESSKITTSYIGTDFQQVKNKAVNLHKDGTITIAYLGYTRQDKGFFFFLDALKKIDAKVAHKINVKFVSAGIWAVSKLVERLKPKFKSVTLIDGFTRKTIKNCLYGVDLGIVPVIWEDCLPQVAIEMAAAGVPVLASNMGGASELCSSPDFTFEGGNTRDFIAKLTAFVTEPEKLSEFWYHYRGLVSLQSHLQELEDYYTRHLEGLHE